MKKCLACGITKPLIEFVKDKRRRDKRGSYCKECNNNKLKLYKRQHRDENNKKAKVYYTMHKKEKAEYAKKYNAEHKQERYERHKKYYAANKEEIQKYQAEHRKNNIYKAREYDRNYQKKNRTKVLQYQKQHYQEHKEEKSQKSKTYYKKNRENILNATYRWGRTTSGKHSRANTKARRRSLGYIPLNKPFGGCDGHHIDNNRVIFIPTDIHKRYPHRQSDPNSMIEINKIALEFMCMGGINSIENFDCMR